jgi:amino acid transporter
LEVRSFPVLLSGLELLCFPATNCVTSYALQWLIALPLEIISASIVTTYWNTNLNKAIFVTIFLFIVVSINLCGVKGYGEAEFVFAIIKVIAVIGFM